MITEDKHLSSTCAWLTKKGISFTVKGETISVSSSGSTWSFTPSYLTLRTLQARYNDAAQAELVYSRVTEIPLESVRVYGVDFLQTRNIDSRQRYKIFHQLYDKHKIDIISTTGSGQTVSYTIRDVNGVYDDRDIQRSSLNRILRIKNVDRACIFKKHRQHITDIQLRDEMNRSGLLTTLNIDSIRNIINAGAQVERTTAAQYRIKTQSAEYVTSRHTLKSLSHAAIKLNFNAGDFDWYLTQIESYITPDDARFVNAVQNRVAHQILHTKLLCDEMLPGCTITNVTPDNRCTVTRNERSITLTLQAIRQRLFQCNGDEKILFDTSVSVFQQQIQNIIKQCGVEYINNDRQILKPQEIDIYIPSMQIGIECNGIAYHAENGVYKCTDRKYHIQKKQLCAEKGIHLLHISEDLFQEKPSIVTSIIRAKLNKYKRILYARKMSMRVIDAKTASIFHDEHHLQGRCSSTLHIGAYDTDNTLQSVISLAPARAFLKVKDIAPGSYELVRFTIAKDTKITGMLSRFIKYAHLQFSIPHIHTFVDLDMFNGNGYIAAGFKYLRNTEPGYSYISAKTYERKHRSSCMKHILIKKYPEWANLTELEIMTKLNYFKVWNCGNLVLEYNFNLNK